MRKPILDHYTKRLFDGEGVDIDMPDGAFGTAIYVTRAEQERFPELKGVEQVALWFDQQDEENTEVNIPRIKIDDGSCFACGTPWQSHIKPSRGDLPPMCTDI